MVAAPRSGVSLFWVLLACFFLTTSGCTGCRKEEDPDAKKRAEKPPVSRGVMRVQPSDVGTMANQHKPGHWGVASLEIVSNREDLRGELATRPISAEGTPLSMNDTGTGVVARRPVVLPKGQPKQLQTRFWLPYRLNSADKRPALETRLTFSGAEIEGGSGADPVSELQGQEYGFLIISKREDAWQFMAAADFTELANDVDTADNRVRWQRVLRPKPSDLEYLPDSLLSFTTVSAVLWDDLRPDQLTESTQQALLDWLHWGGKLVINGPMAIESLRGTPWFDLLPFEDARLTEVDHQSFRDLFQHWTIEGDLTGPELSRELSKIGSIAGVSGQIRPDAESVKGTGDLIVRRRIGRGAVIFTRFDLSSGWLNKWRSGSGMINGAILQLPPRRWDEKAEAQYLASEFRGNERSPNLITGVRLFSRDAANTDQLLRGDEAMEGWSSGPGGSLGEWCSANMPVNLAVENLRSAAGIEIPTRNFVWKSIGMYLAVLIPANFIVFWLLGRVEWAWLMAPILAIIGAAWITRSAQLDIGFARSLNEIDLLELQPGYHRGHLTRALAIYNSLSTTYRLKTETDEVLVGPIGTVQAQRERASLSEMEMRTGYEDGMQIRGVSVPSNRTGMIRAEQMVSLEGGLDLKDDQLTNQTGFDFVDVTVWRNEDNALQVAIVGPLGKNETVKLRFVEPDQFRGWPKSELNMDQYLDQLRRKGCLAKGGVRLIGRLDQVFPGLDLSPVTSQSFGQTAILAHLRYGEMQPNTPDRSIRPLGKKKEEELTFEQ